MKETTMGEKPKRIRVRNSQTVYPPRSVSLSLGGYGSGVLGQAIRCWSRLLEVTTERMELVFAPAEWEFLYQAIGDRLKSLSPEWANPSEQLVQLLARGLQWESILGVPGKGARGSAEELLSRVGQLDYLQAWTLITTLQWRASLGENVKRQDHWWTLAYRQNKLADKA